MRIVFLALSLALAACASVRTPEPVTPHLDGFVPADVDASRPTLGVDAFRDARPERSRVAVTPRFGVTDLAIGWTGELQTGAASFDGNLLDGARADAIATLERSGAFSAVRELEAWGGQAPDYVLSATLEELVALQYRSTRLDLLRIGFFRREVDDAAGIARVGFVLRKGDEAVWEERIETWLRVPGLAPARVALDALAVTHERVAHRLHRENLEGGVKEDPRPLAVRVLDGCALGTKQVRRLFADASEILEREMAVRLVPHPETWSPPADAEGLDRMLEAVRLESPPYDGAVVALVPSRRRAGLLESTRFGLATALGEHAVVTCREREPVQPHTIAHEIGHLFGAVHVRDRASVMNSVAVFDARFFDALNRRILRAARTRHLGAPLESELARELEALYREGADTFEPARRSELERALSSLQRRAAR